MPGPLVGGAIVGAGIAARGIGKALLKNVVKRIKKTPNKAFREDKTYKLSTGTKGKVIKGKTNKKKAIQQQKDIFRKGGVGLRDFSKGRSKGQAAKKDILGKGRK
jgi:prophage antirepressor-like protein